MNGDVGVAVGTRQELGTALARRVDDVVARLRALTARSVVQLNDDIEAHFEDAARTSTIAVARWIGGDPPEVAREAGWGATRIFGMLAAQRAAPLNEATKRCLRWRDAAAEVLVAEAAALGCAAAVVAEALDMLQQSLDVTLVRMCAEFEHERQRLHDELTAQQSQLAFQANHDPLTGLPNRALVIDRIGQALVRSHHDQTAIAVIFVDLDNFKYVNETYGHSTGDHLLQAVVSRLSSVVRGTDTLGHLGGDEFVVVAEGLSAMAGPELVAERILDVLRIPFTIEDQPDTRLTITGSIGVATGERRSAEELLRDADIAMHRAKRLGRDGHAVFDPDMGAAAENRLLLEMDLREAVRAEQFFLVYQPVFELDSMRITGVEALVRWRHPTRGVVQPDDFIPLLEETGVIVTVGAMVLEQACRQGAVWNDLGHDLEVAVNVSARQLERADFVDQLEHIVRTAGFPPQCLALEITETALIHDPCASIRKLTAVKELGVRLAIDDFGTGYSSLDSLRQLPVDTLKIDRSFVARMLYDTEGRVLIDTLIQLGEALHIDTLAEGIESDHQLAELRRRGCAYGQGFFFARPLDAEDVEGFLTSHRKSS